MSEDKLTSQPLRVWTRAEDYFASLARRRTARNRRERPHIHREAPRISLTILPFLMLLAALAIFAAAIVIDAWPGRSHPQAQPKAQPREYGTAPPGWLDQARRDVR